MLLSSSLSTIKAICYGVIDGVLGLGFIVLLLYCLIATHQIKHPKNVLTTDKIIEKRKKTRMGIYGMGIIALLMVVVSCTLCFVFKGIGWTDSYTVSDVLYTVINCCMGMAIASIGFSVLVSVMRASKSVEVKEVISQTKAIKRGIYAIVIVLMAMLIGNMFATIFAITESGDKSGNKYAYTAVNFITGAVLLLIVVKLIESARRYSKNESDVNEINLAKRGIRNSLIALVATAGTILVGNGVIALATMIGDVHNVEGSQWCYTIFNLVVCFGIYLVLVNWSLSWYKYAGVKNNPQEEIQSREHIKNVLFALLGLATLLFFGNIVINLAENFVGFISASSIKLDTFLFRISNEVVSLGSAGCLCGIAFNYIRLSYSDNSVDASAQIDAKGRIKNGGIAFCLTLCVFLIVNLVLGIVNGIGVI